LLILETATLLAFLSINLKVWRRIGLVSIGLVSIGLVSLGLVSLGLVSLGLVSLGLVSLGLVSLGFVSLGLGLVKSWSWPCYSWPCFTLKLLAWSSCGLGLDLGNTALDLARPWVELRPWP